MAKSIEINPLDDGRFLLENSRGAMWNCNDADDIGTFIEAAIWPLIAPALKERKPITINIVIDGKIAEIRSMKDYNQLVRRSIRKDFAKANFKRNGRAPRTPHPKNTRRVLDLNETSAYARFRRLIVGRLVRILELGHENGYWVEFVRDADRDALNAAAGWSQDKRRFLLDGVHFDD